MFSASCFILGRIWISSFFLRLNSFVALVNVFGCVKVFGKHSPVCFCVVEVWFRKHVFW